MERTISSDGFIKEEGIGVTAYYHKKYLFSKLKRRIENDLINKNFPSYIRIGEPVQIDLEVVDLGNY